MHEQKAYYGLQQAQVDRHSQCFWVFPNDLKYDMKLILTNFFVVTSTALIFIQAGCSMHGTHAVESRELY